MKHGMLQKERKASPYFNNLTCKSNTVQLQEIDNRKVDDAPYSVREY